MGRVRGQRVLLAVVLVAAAACAAPERRSVGLAGVRESGQLRVAVRPGFSASPLRLQGEDDQARMLQRLADRLGVDLVLIEARRHDQVLKMVRSGQADLAASRFAPMDLLDDGLEPTAAVDWVEDLIVTTRVASAGKGPDGTPERIHLHRSRATRLRSVGLTEGDVELLPVPEEVTLEDVLERVRGGRYGATVADSRLLSVGRWAGAVGRHSGTGSVRPLVWAVGDRSPRLLSAVNDFLFAEQVLGRGVRTTACRDLRGVRRAGVLRLITRNSPTTCTVDRGGLRGFEYELVREFARRLRVRLELVLPPPGEDPHEWLEWGYGDVAALHEPPTVEQERRFLVSPEYRRVDLVAVTSSDTPPPSSVEELAGALVVTSETLAAHLRLLPLEPRIVPVTAPAADELAALVELARGSFRIAVVSADTVRLESASRPELRVGCTVLPDMPLRWLFNPSSPELAASAARALRGWRRDGTVRQLALSHLTAWQPPRSDRLPEVPEGALTPYDELLQWVARQHGLDWRLLASLMYEESRFDPDAVGPGGSAGLFQFMPPTWRELGVEDPHHPGEAADAAARYVSRLMTQFSDLPLPDRVAMAIASYNVGPRHVFDARRLAEEMKLDPDRWSGNVETALVILDDPTVARRFSAGVCRCRRAANYTRRILRRYHAYTDQFPPA